MSTTIEQKVVEMQFDNSRFEGNVQTSLSTIEKLKRALHFDSSSKGLEAISEQAGKLNFNPMADGLESVRVKFSALEVAGMAVLANLANRAVDTGITFVKSLSVDNIAAGWSKYGEKTVSVGTLISQGYALEEVNEQLNRLNWFTDETSYNFTDMVNNIGKFTATGQKLDDSVTAMEGIALWAALSGQNAQKASLAMYQLSQAMGKGALRYDDFKSIQNASMDTVEFRQQTLAAAEALGKVRKIGEDTWEILSNKKQYSTAQMFASEALTGGAWISSDVMMKTFETYSGVVDQIYEYAEEKGITASEAIEELNGTIDEFGLKAFKAGQEARTWADTVGSVKDAVSTQWMTTFELIFGDYEESVQLWTDLANKFYDIFTASSYARNEILEVWKALGGREAFVNSIYNIVDGLVAAFEFLKGAFERVIPDITGEKLADLSKKVEIATEKFKNFFELFNAKNEENDAEEPVEEAVERVNNLKGAYWSALDTVEDVQEREMLWAKQHSRMLDDFAKNTINSANKSRESTKQITDANADLALSIEEVQARELELSKSRSRGSYQEQQRRAEYEESVEAMDRLQENELELNKKRYIATKTLGREVRSIFETNEELDASITRSSQSIEDDFGSIQSAERLRNTFEGIAAAISIVGKVANAVWTGIKPTIDTAALLISDVSELVSEFFSNLGISLKSFDDDNEAGTKPFHNISKVAYQVMLPVKTVIEKVREGLIWFGETWSEVTNLISNGDYSGIQHLSESLGTLWEKLSSFGSKIFSDLTTNLSKIIGRFSFKDDLPDSEEFADSIDYLSERLARFVDKITPIADIVMGAFTKLQEGIGWIGEVWNYLGTILKAGDFQGIEILSNYIGDLWSRITSVGGGIFDDVVNGVSNFIDKFTFDDPLNTAMGVANALDTVAGGFAKFYEIIKPAVDFVFTVVDKLREGIGWFKDTWSEFWDTINNSKELEGLTRLGEKFSGYWSSIVDGIQKLVGTIFGRSDKLVDGFSFEEDLPDGKKIATSLDKLAGHFADFLDFIDPVLSLIGTVFDTFIGVLNNVFDAVSTVFENLKNVDTSGITAISDDVQEKLSPISSILTGVGKIFGGIWTFIKAVAPAIGTLLGFVGDAIGEFGEKAGKFLSEHANIESFITALVGIVAGGEIFHSLEYLKAFFDRLREGYTVFSGINDFIDDLNWNLEALHSKIQIGNVLKIVAAIGILVLALKLLSTIEPEKIGTGAAAIGILMGALLLMATKMTTAADKLSAILPFMKNYVSQMSLFLIAVSVSILLLSSAVKKLGKLETTDLIQGVLAVGVLMLFVEHLLKVTDKLKHGNIVEGLGSLLAVAVSIRILSGAVKKLGDMSWGELAKGLVGVGAIFVALGVLMKVMDSFKYDSLSKGMLGLVAFAIAIRLLVKPLESLGKDISWEELGKGVVGLYALMSVIGIFALITDAMDKNASKLVAASIGVLIFTAAITVLSNAFMEIGKMSWGEIGKAVVGMLAMIATIGLFAVLADMMTESGTRFVAAAIGVLIFSAALAVLQQVMIGLGGMEIDEVGNAFLVIAGAMLIFAQGAQWLEGSILTLIGFSAALLLLGAALIVLMVPLMMLNSIVESGNIETLILSFAAILVTIVALTVILGTFKEAILTGVLVMGALSLAIAVLGAGLAVLAGALTVFATIGVPGALAFAAAILIIAAAIAAAIPVVIAGVVTGIVVLVALLAQYAPVILQSIIEILYWIAYGIVVALPKVLQGIVDGVIDLILGLIKWFQNTWDKIKNIWKTIFSKDGKKLGENLADSLKGGINGKQEEVVDASGEVGTNVLDEFTKSMEKDGGYGGVIDGSLSGGMDALAKYGVSLPDASGMIGTSATNTFKASFLPTEIIDGESATALEQLNVFGYEGGIAMGDAGEYMNGAFYDQFRGYISGTTEEETDDALEEIENFGDESAESARRAAGKVKKNYHDALTDSSAGEMAMSDASAAEWADTLEATIAGGNAVSDAAGTSGAKAAENYTEEFKKAQKNTDDIAEQIKAKLTTTQAEVGRIGEDTARVYYAGALTDDESTRVVAYAGGWMADQGAAGARSHQNSFYSAGDNAVSGFTNGIYSRSGSIYSAGAYIARQMLYAMRKTLDEHSPSKETEEIGMFAGKGLVNGLLELSRTVYKAGSTVGKEAINGVSKSISKIGDAVKVDADLDPIIRPVLDLSDVKDGMSTIDDAFSAERSIALAGNASIDTAKISNLQNEGQAELMNSIKKLTDAISGGSGETTINIYAREGQDVKALADEVQKRLVQLEQQRRAVYA